MRRLAFAAALMATVAISLAGVSPVAVAAGGPQIDSFSATPVALDYQADGTVQLQAQLTADTDPITAAHVSIADSTAQAVTSVDLTDNGGGSWSGSAMIPWTAEHPGAWTATLTVSDGVNPDASATAPFSVKRTTVITLAFSPSTPHVGQRYSVLGHIGVMDPLASSGYSPLVGANLVLVANGFTYLRTSDSAGNVRVNRPSAPYPAAAESHWSASFGGGSTRTESAASRNLAATRNVTRIVGFNAGPEPAYRHAYISFSGYLQYDDPNAVAWRAYAGKTITISRGSYSATTTTDSKGHFSLTKAGVAAVVGGIWHASFAGTPSFLPTTSGGDEVLTTTAPIRITRVVFDSPGSDLPVTNGKLNAEYVRLTNEGTRTANLYGWRLHDRVSHSYTIDHSVYVAPGHSVYIHTGSGTNTSTQLYWDQSYYVWNNDGDTAYLLSDLGSTVDTCSWSGSGATTSC